jgi:hypothetical protein
MRAGARIITSERGALALCALARASISASAERSLSARAGARVDFSERGALALFARCARSLCSLRSLSLSAARSMLAALHAEALTRLSRRASLPSNGPVGAGYVCPLMVWSGEP